MIAYLHLSEISRLPFVRCHIIGFLAYIFPQGVILTLNERKKKDKNHVK